MISAVSALGVLSETSRLEDAVRSTIGVALVQAAAANGSSFVQSDRTNEGGGGGGGQGGGGAGYGGDGFRGQGGGNTQDFIDERVRVRPAPDPNVVLLGGDPFDITQYVEGLAAGGVDGFDLSGRAFYPEIYYNDTGTFHPICGIDFNDEAATTVCQGIDRETEAKTIAGRTGVKRLKPLERERFTFGGRVVKTNMVLGQDAMPVGACFKGEALDNCTAGSNAFGDLNGLDGRCKKGNPEGVQIMCQRQCRKFGESVWLEEHREMGFDRHETIQREPFENIKVCAPFLKNTTTYYLEDKTWLVENSRAGPSTMEQFASLLNVMNEECSANVVELICHSLFKECKEVEVDPRMGFESVFLPSLLCKEECERHKAMWDSCLAKIQKNPDDKELFDSNMAVMSQLVYGFHLELNGAELPPAPSGVFSPFHLLDCDAKAGMAVDEIPGEEVAASWILGRLRQTHFNPGDNKKTYAGVVGWFFPRFMSSEMLYPEISSTYTGPDGIAHEVPCTIPGEAAAFKTMCPDLFVKSVLPETNRGCVYACPVNQFTLDEYTTMWNVFVGIGMCSFILNLFMVCTWKLSGRREFEAMPFQLKACVFLGLLYGIVETIPSAILKFDLPCVYGTVEDVGSSALCYLSRSGQYLLLGIMVNLCTMTISIYRALVNATGHESNMKVNAFSSTVPLLFMVIAYGLDTDEESAENYNLNAARHAFSCSMRFSTMLEEWLVLWLPFCVSGVLTAVFAIASWWKIGDIQFSLGISAIQVKSEGQKKLEGIRRRLIRIAAMVSACLLLNIGTALSVTAQQSAWTEYEDKKFDCLFKTSSTRNWKDYGFNDQDVVQEVCMVPDGHECNKRINHIYDNYPLEDASTQVRLASCAWEPEKSDSSLVCNFDAYLDQYPDNVEARWSIGNATRKTKTCDCSCTDLLPNAVERPSTFVMILSFASQSMVAAIVALNLGFREDNVDLWKKFFSTTFGVSKASTQVAAANDDFQFDSKAYENDSDVE